MKIAKNTIVTLNYRVTDPAGQPVDEGDQPLTYLHGGYGGIFAKIEAALDGLAAGQTARVNLQPEDAFGLYEEELVSVEDRGLFPAHLEVGMQFERDDSEGGGEDALYTVTDIADDKVVIDGNHPLAGMPLVFTCTVADVRAASAAEIRLKHAQTGR